MFVKADCVARTLIFYTCLNGTENLNSKDKMCGLNSNGLIFLLVRDNQPL